MATNFRACLAISLSLGASAALASDAAPGTVYDLVVAEYMTFPGTPSEAGFFKTTGSRIGTPPACATLPRWTFPVDTPAGQGILATILTAKATGKTIEVLGSGDCRLGSNSEAVGLVRLND